MVTVAVPTMRMFQDVFKGKGIAKSYVPKLLFCLREAMSMEWRSKLLRAVDFRWTADGKRPYEEMQGSFVVCNTLEVVHCSCGVANAELMMQTIKD